MAESNFICIGGYGWSGSTASRDVLKEFESFNTPGFEYPIIAEPYGLIDLDIFLTENWHILRQNKAINDFRRFCKVLEGHSKLFNYFGLDLSNRLSINFQKIVDELIAELVDFEYLGNSRTNYYFMNSWVFLFKRIQQKFTGYKATQMTMARPDREVLLEAFRKFNDQVFENYSKKYPNILLEKALPPSHIYRGLQYFNSAKVILTDRDPRDVFVDLQKSGGLFGPELMKSPKTSVKKFIQWKNAIKAKDDHFKTPELESKIYNLRFEDMVLRYEETLEKIIDFTGARGAKHLTPLKYFNPARSKNNVGLWKKYDDQSVMETIRESIDYPYND